MDSVKSISKRCLVIKADGVIKPTILSFDYDICQFSAKFGANSFELISTNMKEKFGCQHYRPNIATAFYPNHTQYSIFFESNEQELAKKLNSLATQLANSNGGTPIKCYGECYVVHFDIFFDLYDIDKKTFIDSYNIKQTAQRRFDRVIDNIVSKNQNQYKTNNDVCNICTIS